MDRAISLQRRIACRHWKCSGKALWPLPIDHPSPPIPTAAGDVEDITPESARKKQER